MWFFSSPTSNNNPCPNCGNHGFQKECAQCGFVKPDVKEIAGEITLYYCNDCGCHFINSCPLHSTEKE
jgi:hypothetical protein